MVSVCAALCGERREKKKGVFMLLLLYYLLLTRKRSDHIRSADSLDKIFADKDASLVPLIRLPAPDLSV